MVSRHHLTDGKVRVLLRLLGGELVFRQHMPSTSILNIST